MIDGAANPPEAAERETVTMAEASQILGVHPNTIRRWDRLGILKSLRMNPLGHRRFYLRDVNALISKK